MTAKKGTQPFDRWSLVHFASGAALGLLGIPFWACAVILVGFEALEAGLRRIKVQQGGLFEYESWPNVIGDVVVGLAGYGLVWLVRA